MAEPQPPAEHGRRRQWCCAASCTAAEQRARVRRVHSEQTELNSTEILVLTALKMNLSALQLRCTICEKKK